MISTPREVFAQLRSGLVRTSIMLVAAALTSVATQAATPQIKAVRFWSLGEVTRVAIETDGEAQYHAERITDPDRLFIDLTGVRRQAGTRGIQAIPVNDNLVKRIRIAVVEPGTTRVVLDLTTRVEYSISQISNPDRLIIELRLANDRPALPPVRSITGGGALGEAQTGESAPAKAEPASAPPPKPVPLSEAKLNPPATVKPAPASETKVAPAAAAAAPSVSKSIELASSPVNGSAPARTAALTPEPATGKIEPASLPESSRASSPARLPKADVETALAAKSDSRGDTSLIRALGLKLERVVLDPGHGGHDTGTIGPGGMMEKDLVLDVAKRLGVLITRRLSSEVIFTRSDDTFIPLEERTRIANDQKADLFLSIHANSSASPRIAGSETFYLNFSTSADALEVAARENATSQTSIHELQSLVQKIALNEKVQESREFASTMQKALYTGLPRNRSFRNRGVKKAPFVVLINAQMPSVLAEIAFLSNPRDESMLKRADYRQRIAEALFKGVSQYASTLSHFDVTRQRQASVLSK